MKNLILSTIFAVVAFSSNAQSLMINVYEVKTLTKDTPSSVFNILYDSIRYNITATRVNIRYIVNFNNNTVQKYKDGELVLNTTFTIVSELMLESKQFFITFDNEIGLNIGLASEINDIFEFEITTNTSSVILFDNVSIF